MLFHSYAEALTELVLRDLLHEEGELLQSQHTAGAQDNASAHALAGADPLPPR